MNRRSFLKSLFALGALAVVNPSALLEPPAPKPKPVVHKLLGSAGTFDPLNMLCSCGEIHYAPDYTYAFYNHMLLERAKYKHAFSYGGAHGRRGKIITIKRYNSLTP